MGTTASRKPKLYSFKDTAIGLGYNPGLGTAIVAEMVRVHKITPVEVGNAKGLDIDDIKVIAKALGKTTEAFV